MKLSKLAVLASLLAVPVMGWAGQYEPEMQAGTVAPVSFLSRLAGNSCDGGCETVAMGCDDSCSLDRNGLGIFNGRFLNGNCRGDEPFSLFGEIGGIEVGGWAQFGYHDQNLPLFNSRKNNFQLHQGWIYAEKAVDGSNGFDLGGRVDYLYGTDGPDTQAFGIDNNHWDNQWDNGSDYGHALPQVYLEAAYGDWSVKAGHFFTIIGYEVVAAPDNFFYSHAYTMYNSEPFTHTGAIITYDYTEDIQYFGGWVLGWDSGFEDNGDAYLGGSSVNWTDDINVTSTLTAGRFADNSGGDERGYMSSTVASVALTEKLTYVFQADYLDTEDASGATVRDTYGINQYLLRTISDRVSIGARLEWWSVESDSAGFHGDLANAAFDPEGDFDVYALTLGANLRPHPNVIIRPEIRWDYVFGDEQTFTETDFAILEDGDDTQTTFGIDTIFLF